MNEQENRNDCALNHEAPVQLDVGQRTMLLKRLVRLLARQEALDFVRDSGKLTEGRPL